MTASWTVLWSDKFSIVSASVIYMHRCLARVPALKQVGQKFPTDSYVLY